MTVSPRARDKVCSLRAAPSPGWCRAACCSSGTAPPPRAPPTTAAPEPEIHMVGPEFAGWPSGSTGNPYEGLNSWPKVWANPVDFTSGAARAARPSGVRPSPCPGRKTAARGRLAPGAPIHKRHAKQIHCRKRDGRSTAPGGPGPAELCPASRRGRAPAGPAPVPFPLLTQHTARHIKRVVRE